MSAHLGARVQGKGQPQLAGHDNWQGKVYKIRGSEKGYPNLLESTGYDIDSQSGFGSVVNPLGLHGYNCRHSHKPWDIRLRNPYVDENGNLKIDSEENRKRYELQQKQRSMERSIRATNRKLIEKQEQIELVTDPELKEKLQNDYGKLSFKWTRQNKAYNDFCKENDLQPQDDRIKVTDFGREQTKKANAGERQHADKQNELQNNVVSQHTDRYKANLNINQNRNIIKERISNGEYSLALSKQQYLKHVEGTKQYSDYENSRREKGQLPQGRIIISDAEVQEIIKGKYATGKPRVTKDGKVANVEYVNADKVVGRCYVNGQWIDTKRVAIHYGKRGSHIVPVEDKND